MPHVKPERGSRPEYRKTVKTNNEPPGGDPMPQQPPQGLDGISSQNAIVKAPGTGRRTDQQLTNTNK